MSIVVVFVHAILVGLSEASSLACSISYEDIWSLGSTKKVARVVWCWQMDHFRNIAETY